MSNCELTVKNLACIGLLDDFYQLYFDIETVYCTEFEQTKSVDKVQTNTMGKIRKLIDTFLSQTTYVFTKEYDKLHPNADAMKITMRFLDVKPYIKTSHKHMMGFEVRMESIKRFLEIFEIMIADILVRRKSHDGVYISPDKAIEEINNNILLLAKNSAGENLLSSDTCNKEKLIIFKSLSLISCNTKTHKVVPLWLSVSPINSNSTIKIPVHHCLTCGRIFIGKETLKVYENMYGKLLIKTVDESNVDTENYILAGESELHQYGYNVIHGKMSEDERHSLLIALIKENKMSEFEIKRDIENAIRIFDGRYSFALAIQKWKNDLKFISEYSRSNF